MSSVSALRSMEAAIDMKLVRWSSVQCSHSSHTDTHTQVPVLEAHDLITNYDVGVTVTDEDEAKVEELAVQWTELKQLAEDTNDELQARSPEFKQELRSALKQLATDVQRYVTRSAVMPNNRTNKLGRPAMRSTGGPVDWNRLVSSWLTLAIV